MLCFFLGFTQFFRHVFSDYTGEDVTVDNVFAAILLVSNKSPEREISSTTTHVSQIVRMEKMSEIAVASTRKLNLKKAFKLELHSLLTTPSLQPQSLKMLFVMSAIHLDDETDNIENTVSLALVDSNSGSASHKAGRLRTDS